LHDASPVLPTRRESEELRPGGRGILGIHGRNVRGARRRAQDAWAISPDSGIASWVSSVPFLVAIQSGNQVHPAPYPRSRRRLAEQLEGAGRQSHDLVPVDRVDQRLWMLRIAPAMRNQRSGA
jgi:hypothetical protein